MSRDDATLLDILKAARLVVEFKRKLAKKAFLRDIKTQSAILHQLLVIGEAVKDYQSSSVPNILRSPGQESRECVIN